MALVKVRQLAFVASVVASWLCMSLPVAIAEVKSAPCPFSCRSNGYGKGSCKDWREGNTCYIEIAERRVKSGSGKVEGRPCPHSCKTRGIKKRFCKDWREGNTCYVKDLR